MPFDRQAYQRAYAAKHRERKRQITAAWRAANPERARAKVRELWADPERRAKYNARKREYIKAYSQTDAYKASQAAWRERNKGHLAEKGRRWRTANPDKNSAKANAYRCRKLTRIPSWVTASEMRAIEKFYELAARLTQETGVEHHVDHIVPLKGRRVSGLHVSTNLRVIPARENLRKGCRY